MKHTAEQCFYRGKEEKMLGKNHGRRQSKMEKTTVSVPFDKEKTVALQIYLGQKNTTLDIELGKSMDSLYSKIVPNLVRDFIQKKEEISTKKKEV